MEETRFYTELEASQVLGISRKTLERHRRTGKIHPARLGKGWCYTKADLAEWQRKYESEVARKQIQAASGIRIRLT